MLHNKYIIHNVSVFVSGIIWCSGSRTVEVTSMVSTVRWDPGRSCTDTWRRGRGGPRTPGQGNIARTEWGGRSPGTRGYNTQVSLTGEGGVTCWWRWCAGAGTILLLWTLLPPSLLCLCTITQIKTGDYLGKSPTRFCLVFTCHSNCSGLVLQLSIIILIPRGYFLHYQFIR